MKICTIIITCILLCVSLLYLVITIHIIRNNQRYLKLLGIDIDYQLNFDKHIKNICRKASQQLSVLKRIGCFFFI